MGEGGHQTEVLGFGDGPVDQHQGDPVRSKRRHPVAEGDDRQRQRKDEGRQGQEKRLYPRDHRPSSARPPVAAVNPTSSAFITSSTSRPRSSPALGWARTCANDCPGRRLHDRHPAYRVSRWEYPAQPRRHEQVALLNVGAVGQVGQVQQARFSGAQGDGSQTGPVDGDGQPVIGIADQYGLGGQGIHDIDLADHTIGIQQCLTDIHAVQDAPIDGEPLPKGVRVHGENLGDQHPIGDTLTGIQHGAQPVVLRFECVHELQTHVVVAKIAFQACVLVEQRCTAGEGLTCPAPGGEGLIHPNLHRVDDH